MVTIKLERGSQQTGKLLYGKGDETYTEVEAQINVDKETKFNNLGGDEVPAVWKYESGEWQADAEYVWWVDEDYLSFHAGESEVRYVIETEEE